MAGNRSKNSNKVTVSLPRDINPPTVPVLTATDVGPTHVSLSWSSTDEGSTIYYTVYRDGVKFFSDTAATGCVDRHSSAT